MIKAIQKVQNLNLLRFFVAFILLLTISAQSTFALDFDDSIDDDIRKNYNPNKIEEDMQLPSLPKILNEDSNSTALRPAKVVVEKPVATVAKPVSKVVEQPIEPQVEKPLNKISPAKKYLPIVAKSQTSYITLKKGTRLKLALKTPISDKTKRGTKVTFISKYPVSTTYYTIPAGTIFKGEVVNSHKPQLSANGGLIVLRITSMIVNGEVVPIRAFVTNANHKRIFFNNIKGKRKYLASMVKASKPGCRFCKKMMRVTASLAVDGSSILLTPFSVIFGVVGASGNIIASPALALFYKGGSISLPENANIDAKLDSDFYIYK